VKPTDAAHELVRRIRRERTAAVRRAIERLDAHEREQLLSALPALVSLAELLGEAQA
jgi:DNA-binding MarR family transcriptional regulator